MTTSISSKAFGNFTEYMLICKTNLQKKLDLYLNYSLRKSSFPLNLMDIQTYRETYRQTDINVYRVASLLKMLLSCLSED